jgi:hypothetical protein
MFYRNTNFTEIGTFDPEVFTEFKTILRKLCLLNSFEQDYEIQKLIGETEN